MENIYSVKYSLNGGKDVLSETFTSFLSANDFALAEHRKGAVIYGIYKNGNIM